MGRAGFVAALFVVGGLVFAAGAWLLEVYVTAVVVKGVFK